MSETTPREPALQAVQLYKFYGPKNAQVPVLQELSFHLDRGEFLCLMGPSGSGKSTLLHILSGIEEPSGGDVLVDGTSLLDLPPAERTRLRRDRIGYVFQFFHLLPNLTVEENVGLPLAIRGERIEGHRDEIGGMLERFGIAGRERALPHELSGGQMQRASIARALAGGQQLLLCDEPTGNLSQKAGQEIMETLRRVCDEDGRSVLLVTHNPRDATYADRVRFLIDGRLDAEHELRGPGLTVEAIHEHLSALHI